MHPAAPRSDFPFQQGCTEALPTTFGAVYLVFFVMPHLLSLPMESLQTNLSCQESKAEGCGAAPAGNNLRVFAK